MVKHVILWKLKEELTAEEKENVKVGIKEGLEGLAGNIPGLVDIKVNINGLATSTVDVMLDTTFTDADYTSIEKDLKEYTKTYRGSTSYSDVYYPDNNNVGWFADVTAYNNLKNSML